MFTKSIYPKYDNGSKSWSIAITQCSAIHPICDCMSVAVSDGVCVCTAGNVERRYSRGCHWLGTAVDRQR